MTDFPSLTGGRLIRVLRKFGFQVIRVKGSHHFLQHEDGRRTVVPLHRGEIIGPGLLARVLRNCELSKEELREKL